MSIIASDSLSCRSAPPLLQWTSQEYYRHTIAQTWKEQKYGIEQPALSFHSYQTALPQLLEQSCCVVVLLCCSLPHCSGAVYFFVCGLRLLLCSKSNYFPSCLKIASLHTAVDTTSKAPSLWGRPSHLCRCPGRTHYSKQKRCDGPVSGRPPSSAGTLGWFSQGIFTWCLPSEACLISSGVESNNFPSEDQRCVAVCSGYAVPVFLHSRRMSHWESVSMRANNPQNHVDSLSVDQQVKSSWEWNVLFYLHLLKHFVMVSLLDIFFPRVGTQLLSEPVDTVPIPTPLIAQKQF